MVLRYSVLLGDMGAEKFRKSLLCNKMEVGESGQQ